MNKKKRLKRLKKAFKVLKKEINKDPDYAYAWHCNIAMMCYDAMRKNIINSEYAHGIGNDAASRFMKLCFDVQTKSR